MSKKTLNTPIGTLNYTFISGEGRVSLSGVSQYSTQLVLTKQDAEPLLAEIDALWKESRIKKQPKSMGYKTLEDGTIAFSFKTNTEINGKRNKVKVYDAKGKEADFSEIMIGNGTKGRVGATLSVYDQPTGSGITSYLTKIQVIELIEYTGSDEGFEEVSGGYEFKNDFENEPKVAPSTIKRF